MRMSRKARRVFQGRQALLVGGSPLLLNLAHNIPQPQLTDGTFLKLKRL